MTFSEFIPGNGMVEALNFDSAIALLLITKASHFAAILAT